MSASTLHNESIVIVAHDHMLDEASLLEMADGGVTAKGAIVSVDALLWEDGGRRFVESLSMTDGWHERAMRRIEELTCRIAAHPDRLMLALTGDDILQAKAQGKSAILIGFEGGKPLEGSIEHLRECHRAGLRQLQFTWAFRNALADAQEDPENGGLTPFGRQVAQELSRLGIVADGTHLSRRAFRELLDLSDVPVIASHSGSFAFCPDPGNLRDEDLQALARQGGVAGVHFCSHIVKGPDCVATLDDLVDHIAYIADLVGVDHVGIGGDYFPVNDAYVTAQQQFMAVTDPGQRGRTDLIYFVKGLENISRMPRLTEHLQRRGFKDDDVRKIIGGNWLRVYRQVLK